MDDMKKYLKYLSVAIAIIIPVIIPAPAHPVVSAALRIIGIIPITAASPVTLENTHMGAGRRIIAENVSVTGFRAGILVSGIALNTKGKSSAE